MKLHHSDKGSPQIERGYETQDNSFRYLLWAGIGVAVFLVFGHLVAGLVFLTSSRQTALRDPAPLPAIDLPRLSPGPMLQANPPGDLKQMQKAELDALDSYGWTDRNAGIVRIPVSRAMDVILERGLPTRAAGAQTRPAEGGSR